LRTGRELDDFRRMPQMLHAPGCGKTVGRMSEVWPCFREISGRAAGESPRSGAQFVPIADDASWAGVILIRQRRRIDDSVLVEPES